MPSAPSSPVTIDPMILSKIAEIFRIDRYQSSSLGWEMLLALAKIISKVKARYPAELSGDHADDFAKAIIETLHDHIGSEQILELSGVLIQAAHDNSAQAMKNFRDAMVDRMNEVINT